MLNSGDKVLVKKILVGCAPGFGEPASSWQDGYEFVQYEDVRLKGKLARVRHTSGMFNQMDILVDMNEVKIDSGVAF